ncbi:hypothetical protein P2H44_25255 [Albimonas sp. CAU 1670]|uniref:hypothetical protein n=1 Tax=Albimonas sp. CAU 1670 TaxID=3032599 RepID=UPI0023DBB413|nr:hypothetical protein [Albimonas sp. CAU 1670]MDF2235874.1 hypothetical protein [Albimonas sp. CAU 1670]
MTRFALPAALLAFAVAWQPLAAQDADPSVTAITNTVTESAGRISTAFEAFTSAMDSANVEDAAVQALDQMLEAVRGVNADLGRDSEAWAKLEELIASWSKKRDDLLEKSRDNPALAEVAELWQDKLDRIGELKLSILDQAADSELLVEEIEDKREVIIAYMEVDSIDQVMAAMETMNAELTAMNDSMRTILEQTAGLDETDDEIEQ